MYVDNPNHKDGFDKMLKNALSGPLDPIRTDFADDMLRELKKREQQKILAKVILQERLALAGCILVPVLALVAMFACPQAVTALSAWMKNCYDAFLLLVTTEQFNWQIWAVFASAAGLAVYSLFNLFLTDG